jgi:hypothetical protein
VNLSPRSFKLGLYAEHLEEIGFLFTQCQALRADPNQPWTACAPFEERLEAHLDALVVGDTLAAEWCQARLPEAEPEALFGITTLLCRRGDAAAIKPLLVDPRLDDAAALQAVGLALLQEWPAAWQSACLRALAQGDPRLVPTFAAIAATRGWPVGSALSQALDRAPPAARPSLLAWLGCTPGDAWPALARALDDADPAVRSAALRAGLRLHDAAARERVVADTCHPDLLALAAGRGTAARLLKRLDDPPAAPAAIAALGQLGELSAVRALTALLPNEALGGLAARALHLITGAELFETMLEPDPVKEDELTEAELKRWREAGEAPRRLDGEPFGNRVERLSLDPAVWGQWLVDNGARFSATRRYRLGEPCGAAVLLRSLAHPGLPAAGREALADELIVRHGGRG